MSGRILESLEETGSVVYKELSFKEIVDDRGRTMDTG